MIRIILIDDHAIVRTGYRRLLDAEPGLQVVGEAASADEAKITQALRSGALGYLTKHCEPSEVIDGIHRVATGKRVFSPEIAQILAQEAADGNDAFSHLTPREFEVLRMLVQGESSTGIASSMHLSQKTVLNYLSLIRQKLDVENDFKLLHLAARHGLVDISHAIRA